MPITINVAASAKQEHAYRTCLAGLTTLVLALVLTILPTFKSPISSVNNSDFRLLGLRDLCKQERDDCRNDPNKDKPGLCGCSVPDTNMDGDGTPDCHDGSCPHDASKMSPDVCGCGNPDNDPSIVSICKDWGIFGYDCEGCAKDYYRRWKNCNKQCLDHTEYCLKYKSESRYEYDGVYYYSDFYFKSGCEELVQSGDDSSKSIWVYTVDCDLNYSCDESIKLNNVPCYFHDFDNSECLWCEDGNYYCYDSWGDPPGPSNPYYWYGDEARSLISACFGWDRSTATPSVKTLSEKMPKHAHASLLRLGA